MRNIERQFATERPYERGEGAEGEQRFLLPELDAAEEEHNKASEQNVEGYTWVGAGREAQGSLRAQIERTEGLIEVLEKEKRLADPNDLPERLGQSQKVSEFNYKKGKGGVAQEYKDWYDIKLQVLQGKWARLEVLSSEGQGSQDQELNGAAYFKALDEHIERTGDKEGKDFHFDEISSDPQRMRQFNDAAREELLRRLIEKLSPEQIDEEWEEMRQREEDEHRPVKDEEALVPLPPGKLAERKPTGLVERRPAELARAPERARPKELPAAERQKALPEHERPLALPPHKERKKKEKVVFAEISDVVEQEARDIAETRIEEERRQLKGVRHLLKRVFKHNLLDAYFRRRELGKARREIADTKNLYVDETADATSSDRAKEAILQRFASDYEQEMLSAGELKERHEELSEAVKEAINQYAQDGDNAEFQRRCDVILVNLAAERGVDVSELRDSVNYINNLHKTAERIRNNYEELERLGRGQEVLLDDVEVIWGEAKSSVKTEAQYNRIDKLIDKLEKETKHFSKLTSAVNELTIGAGAALAYCAARTLSQTALRSRAAKIFTFGGTAAVASGIAAAKENKRLIAERKKHLRDVAKGKEFEPLEERPRRAEMQEYQYETMAAAELMQPLEQLYESYDLNGQRELRDGLTVDDFQAALSALAQIKARVRLNDEHRVDLITYSKATAVEDERFRLNLLRAVAKVDLGQAFDQVRGGLGIARNVEFDQHLNEASEQIFRERNENREEQDKRFKKMKAKKVAKRAAATFVIGAGIGLAVQEVGAFVSKGQEGALESLVKRGGEPAERMTILRRVFGGELRPHEPTVASTLSIGGREIPITLPKDTELIDPDGDGIFSLVHNGEEICDVGFNEDGSLTEATQQALAVQGIGWKSGLDTITKEVGGGGDPESISGYIDEHKGLFGRIKRILWYDNNTEAPKFDENELRLWWGGAGNTGLTPEGDYVFDISQMKPGGSYHADLSIDAQQAMKAGKLKILLSLDKASQNRVFEVAIKPDGSAVIPKDSEIAKVLFRETAEGKAEFLGKYAEVAEMVGKKAGDGREMVRILATHVGEGTAEVPSEVIEQIPKHLFEIPSKVDWDLPPFIPVVGRYPLEPERRGEAPLPGPAPEPSPPGPPSRAPAPGALPPSRRSSLPPSQQPSAIGGRKEEALGPGKGQPEALSRGEREKALAAGKEEPKAALKKAEAKEKRAAPRKDRTFGQRIREVHRSQASRSPDTFWDNFIFLKQNTERPFYVKDSPRSIVAICERAQKKQKISAAERALVADYTKKRLGDLEGIEKRHRGNRFIAFERAILEKLPQTFLR